MSYRYEFNTSENVIRVYDERGSFVGFVRDGKLIGAATEEETADMLRRALGKRGKP